MSCEDFIETIRKHHLYSSQSKLLQAMQRREAEIALFVRQDLMARGEAVPAEIEQVYQVMKATAEPAAAEATTEIGTKRKARLQDLNRLASSADEVPATGGRAANMNKQPNILQASKPKPDNALTTS